MPPSLPERGNSQSELQILQHHYRGIRLSFVGGLRVHAPPCNPAIELTVIAKSRHCLIPGCPGPRPDHGIFCSKHWVLVGPADRRELYLAFNRIGASIAAGDQADTDDARYQADLIFERIGTQIMQREAA